MSAAENAVNEHSNLTPGNAILTDCCSCKSAKQISMWDQIWYEHNRAFVLWVATCKTGRDSTLQCNFTHSSKGKVVVGMIDSNTIIQSQLYMKSLTIVNLPSSCALQFYAYKINRWQGILGGSASEPSPSRLMRLDAPMMLVGKNLQLIICGIYLSRGGVVNINYGAI